MSLPNTWRTHNGRAESHAGAADQYQQVGAALRSLSRGQGSVNVWAGQGLT